MNAILLNVLMQSDTEHITISDDSNDSIFKKGNDKMFKRHTDFTINEDISNTSFFNFGDKCTSYPSNNFSILYNAYLSIIMHDMVYTFDYSKFHNDINTLLLANQLSTGAYNLDELLILIRSKLVKIISDIYDYRKLLELLNENDLSKFYIDGSYILVKKQAMLSNTVSPYYDMYAIININQNNLTFLLENKKVVINSSNTIINVNIIPIHYSQYMSNVHNTPGGIYILYPYDLISSVSFDVIYTIDLSNVYSINQEIIYFSYDDYNNATNKNITIPSNNFLYIDNTLAYIDKVYLTPILNKLYTNELNNYYIIDKNSIIINQNDTIEFSNIYNNTVYSLIDINTSDSTLYNHQNAIVFFEILKEYIEYKLPNHQYMPLFDFFIDTAKKSLSLIDIQMYFDNNINTLFKDNFVKVILKTNLPFSINTSYAYEYINNNKLTNIRTITSQATDIYSNDISNINVRYFDTTQIYNNFIFLIDFFIYCSSSPNQSNPLVAFIDNIIPISNNSIILSLFQNFESYVYINSYINVTKNFESNNYDALIVMYDYIYNHMTTIHIFFINVVNMFINLISKQYYPILTYGLSSYVFLNIDMMQNVRMNYSINKAMISKPIFYTEYNQFYNKYNINFLILKQNLINYIESYHLYLDVFSDISVNASMALYITTMLKYIGIASTNLKITLRTICVDFFPMLLNIHFSDTTTLLTNSYCTHNYTNSIYTYINSNKNTLYNEQELSISNNVDIKYYIDQFTNYIDTVRLIITYFDNNVSIIRELGDNISNELKTSPIYVNPEFERNSSTTQQNVPLEFSYSFDPIIDNVWDMAEYVKNSFKDEFMNIITLNYANFFQDMNQDIITLVINSFSSYFDNFLTYTFNIDDVINIDDQINKKNYIMMLCGYVYHSYKNTIVLEMNNFINNMINVQLKLNGDIEINMANILNDDLYVKNPNNNYYLSRNIDYNQKLMKMTATFIYFQSIKNNFFQNYQLFNKLNFPSNEYVYKAFSDNGSFINIHSIFNKYLNIYGELVSSDAIYVVLLELLNIEVDENNTLLIYDKKITSVYTSLFTKDLQITKSIHYYITLYNDEIVNELYDTMMLNIDYQYIFNTITKYRFLNGLNSFTDLVIFLGVALLNRILYPNLIDDIVIENRIGQNNIINRIDKLLIDVQKYCIYDFTNNYELDAMINMINNDIAFMDAYIVPSNVYIIFDELYAKEDDIIIVPDEFDKKIISSYRVVTGNEIIEEYNDQLMLYYDMIYNKNGLVYNSNLSIINNGNETIIQTNKIILPIYFNFFRYTNNNIPLCCMINSKIRFEFITSSNFLNIPTYFKQKNSNEPHELKIIQTAININKIEKMCMLDDSLMNIYEQQQYTYTKIIISNQQSITINLNSFTFPTKYFLWRVLVDGMDDHEYIQNIQIMIMNREYGTTKTSYYYKKYMPYKHLHVYNKYNFYLCPFSLYPLSLQPSGHIGMASVSDAKLILNLSNDNLMGMTFEVHFWAFNYNFLNIYKGIVAPIFTI